MNQSLYLTFPEPDDYLAWLQRANEPSTHLDLTVRLSKATGPHGIRVVYYYATATQRVGEVIAVCAQLLYQTTTAEVAFETARARAKRRPSRLGEIVQARFCKVQKAWEEKSLSVARGVWSHKPPFGLEP